jgi:hypothetical protein
VTCLCLFCLICGPFNFDSDDEELSFGKDEEGNLRGLFRCILAGYMSEQSVSSSVIKTENSSMNKQIWASNHKFLITMPQKHTIFS